MELRIICTKKGAPGHGIVELAALMWKPETNGAEVVVWDARARPREFRIEALFESTRPTRAPVARAMKRASVRITERSEGGQTVHVPPCPRCDFPGREIRDTRLREYIEATRNTALAGMLDVSRIR